MQRCIAVLIGTWLGSGLIPPVIVSGMAGTYGSAAAIPLCFALLQLAGKGGFPILCYALVTIFVFTIGVWSIPLTERWLGPKKDWRGRYKTHDQNQIVIDEVAGMLVSSFPILWFDSGSLWEPLFAAFVFFRLFDIAKPQPVKCLDGLENAYGVMLDDIAAGAYAAIALWLLHIVSVF